MRTSEYEQDPNKRCAWQKIAHLDSLVPEVRDDNVATIFGGETQPFRAVETAKSVALPAQLRNKCFVWHAVHADLVRDSI